MDDERVLELMLEPADVQPDLDVQPTPAGHERPCGVNDLTVAAVGTLTDAMETARDQLTGGKRRLNEAEMKQRRVTPGHPGYDI